MYKYENKTLVPYMYAFNNVLHFVKEEYKNEYEYQGKKDPSWYEKTWNKVRICFEMIRKIC